MLGATSLTHGEFVAVDIETTGCRPGSSGIIEIGAVMVRAGVIVNHFQALVCPDEPIPASIQALTGINDLMVADAPRVEEVMIGFREFVGDAVLVAHNHRFDMGFLDYEAERAWGTSFSRPVLDTLTLARRLHPELDRHNLRVLASYYGVDAVPNHRAPADALATAQILQLMLVELQNQGFTTAEDVARFCGQARQGVLASKLVLATHLPDASGVYIFRDASGAVIYIGRAKNLRMRVRGYFYGPTIAGHSHPASEATSVQHLACASDLDALLIESRLVARYQPRFNKDQQRGRTPAYIRVDVASRYPSFRVVKRRPKTGQAIGPLTNVWAAETLASTLKQRFGLRRCTRRLGTTPPPCTERASSGCPRPCTGAITPEEYGRRVEAALGVFDGGALRLRAALQALRERAATDLHYEEAILHRDAIRALDRTMSGLEVVRAAAAEPGVAIIEGHDDAVVVHLVRHGRLGRTLRFSRASISDGAFEEALRRAVARVYSAERLAEDAYDISQRHLRDVFVIDTYRRQRSPAEVPLLGSIAQFVGQIVTVARRRTRVPKKLHGVPSAD